jgi:drug/metabolite transporter (DMT)-like permease
MYITYIYSFRFLLSHQVALFTIFTPLYLTAFDDLLQKRFHPLFLLSAALAVAGTAVITFTQISQSDLRAGFFIIQLSNICFACGQVLYKRLMAKCPGSRDHSVFAWLYLGAVLITSAAVLLKASDAGWASYWLSLSMLNPSQITTLLYLGAIASGLCFFLWNFGARKTNTGALAVFNNMKIPLAVACSLLVFGERSNIPRLLCGGALIIAALFLNELVVRRSGGRSRDQNKLS